MKTARTFLGAAVVLVMLAACGGESNPLIGTWNVEVQSDNSTMSSLMKNMGGGATTTFTKDEVISKQGGHEQRQKALYKKISDKSWSFSVDGGARWDTLEFQDNNTIIVQSIDMGVGKMRTVMKRVK